VSHVTADDLALVSDDVKYASVAVSERAYWQRVVPQKPNYPESLPVPVVNKFMMNF